MLRAVLVLAALAWSTVAAAADSAAVVMYHRFGEADSPSTNTRLDQLDAHIRELRGGGYRVLPLPEIVAALEAGRPLPEKTVAITIDDAWASVHRNAWPRLKAAGLPFTLFVVTDETDRGGGEYMSWADIRELADSGLVTIGSQGAAHPHMAAMSALAVGADLARSQARFQAELGREPELFAWPFGEMGREAEKAARAAGFKAAFGQHSGVAWAGAERFFLPRFAMNETHGTPDRFRRAVQALPLKAIEVSPADPHLAGANPPVFAFTLAEGDSRALNCYLGSGDALLVRPFGPRIEVRPHSPFAKGRARINCTQPAPEGRWRWFGWQFTVP